MKRNLLYLLLLISLSVNAKTLTVPNPNFKTESKKENKISATIVANTCHLDVTIGFTLDTPTSTFFVNIAGLNGTAPYTYLLDGNPSPNGNTFYASTLNPGTHTVVVQDSNGCSGTGTFEVQNPLPSLSAITQNPSCTKLGNIILTVTGGVEPYYYSIDGGIHFSLGALFTNLNAGTYNTLVKDSNGNISGFLPIDLIAPEPLKASAILTKPLDCNGYASCAVVTTGGSAPYAYSIDGGAFVLASSNFINLILPAGLHSIIMRDSYGCVSNTTSIAIEPLTPLAFTYVTKNILCNGLNNGSITITVTNGTGAYKYSIDNGASYQSYPTFTNLAVGTYYIVVTDSNGCSTTTKSIIITEPEPITATLTIENRNLTINASGGTGPYFYRFNSGTYSASNVFYTSDTYGYIQVDVRDWNACSFSTETIISPPAPLLNGEKTLDIKFTLGQTLGDIIVDGQNIKWYSNNGNTNNKTKFTEPTLLPSTLLVDNTTYYASQTINGFESKERLAVTAKLSLSTSEFVLPNFNFYPNPVKHNLTLSNTATIETIEIASLSGKTILTKRINSDHSEIDLSNLSTGVYFLKVKSEGKEKTVKFIKE